MRTSQYLAIVPLLLGVSAFAAPNPPAWNVPRTTLPADLVSAIRSLFLDGAAPMASPAGGEYREVAIQVTGPSNGDAETVSTHAWVLDSTTPAPGAVCWNGIAYPVLKLGKKIDLRDDINLILAKELTALENYRKVHNNVENYDLSRPRSDQPELVAYDTFDVQHVVMLLAARRTDLAENFWEVYIHGFEESSRQTIIDGAYESLVYPYIETRARRALGFFARGQDTDALAESRACTAATNTATKILTQRNRDQRKDQRGAPDPDIQYFDRFNALQPHRRSETPPYDPVLANPSKYPDKKARIAALIRDLELVGNIPEGSTDNLQIMPDVVVQLLAAEGDDIVEPLLQCYERDTRYTRRVNEPEGSLFSGPVSLEPVKVRDLALDAVQRIAGFRLDAFRVSSEGAEMTDDQRTAAQLQAFRAFWAKLNQLRPEDRAYAILADDDLSPDLWIQAAYDISGYDGATRYDPEWQKIRQHLRHLPDSQPSVHDLMVKRFQHAGNARGPSGESVAGGLIESLARWDGKTALTTLREIDPGFDVAHLTYEQRVQLGDPKALQEYGAWLKNLTPEFRSKALPNAPDLFRLLWEYPNDPAAKAAADWAFQSSDSPWNPILPVKLRPGESANGPGACLNSPLLALPPFRRQAIALLDNAEEVGTVGVGDDGYRYVRLKEGWPDPNRGIITTEDLKPLIGHPLPIRACDIAAAYVALVPGAPHFELHWSQARRDTAIAALKDFLPRYGPHIIPGRHLFPPYGNLEIDFSPLSAPATPAQLADGDAIFCLNGQGAAQTVKMFLPRRARWFTNKELAVKDHFADPYTGKDTLFEIGNNEGAIWQAEDLTVNGKTQRYFGFVWAGGMNRVRAEQMDLIPDWRPGPQWTEMQHGTDLMIIPGGKLVPNTLPLPYHLAAAAPVTLTLRLRNRRAVAQPIDSSLIMQDPAAHTLRLRDGLSLHLVKLRLGASPDSIADPAKSTPVIPLNPITTFAPGRAAGPMRQPEEEFTAATLNLRDYYNLTGPATYGLWLTDAATSPQAAATTPPVCIILEP